MGLPRWLKTVASDESRVTCLSGRQARYALRKRNEQFLDRTLRQVISFVQDTMFNESLSARKGLLQMIEPEIKVVTLLIFVIVLSLQKSVEGIAVFSLLAVILVFASRLPLSLFVKRLLPAAVITLFIAVPVMLNLIVEGDPLFVLLRFGGPLTFGPLTLPKEIAVTRQGLESAITLLLRVLTSVSLVFLLTMTTPPNIFVKTLSSLVPGSLQPVVSVSYRYIFFLVRKVEHFIMGLRSRQIIGVKASGGRHWVASRIGQLFSMSMEFSTELSMAMESRGYRGEKLGVLAPASRLTRQSSRFRVGRFSPSNIAWLVFSILFVGVMIWKSLA